MGQAGVMAITLPLPLRVAAGLLATGIDLVRSLPEDIPAIPVTLVGNAMRLSMKFQQEIATLATRGDELLGGVIGAPQENPPGRSSMTTNRRSPHRSRPEAGPAGRSQTGSRRGTRLRDVDDHRIDRRRPSANRNAHPTATDRGAETHPTNPDGHELKTPTTTGNSRPRTTTAMEAALEVSDALVERPSRCPNPRPRPRPRTPRSRHRRVRREAGPIDECPAEHGWRTDDRLNWSTSSGGRSARVGGDGVGRDRAATSRSWQDGGDGIEQRDACPANSPTARKRR